MIAGALLGALASPLITAALLATRQAGRRLARTIHTWRKTVTSPADEIMNAAQRLRHRAGIVPPHIADPLAKVMESFAATEFDPEAGIQETDGRHRRMLRLARQINGGQP